MTPQSTYIHSKGVHAHISPHSKDHRGGRGLSKNYLWSQQVNSKSRIITHAFSPQAHLDYAEVRYVKKPSGAKPGMVIYTNYKTAYVDTAEKDE